MDFRTIEELAELTGKSRRTIDRRLNQFRKQQPEKFSELTKKESQNRTLYSIELIPLINEKPVQIIQELAEELKEIPQPKRQRKTKVETPQVVHIEEMTTIQKERWGVFNVIIDAYKQGTQSLGECVTSNNMTLARFYAWLNEDPAMNSAYKDAWKQRKEWSFQSIRELALDQLAKSIKGYDVNLESTSYIKKVGPDGQEVLIPQEHRVNRKHVLPRSDLIMFALTNRDPEEWKRMFSNLRPDAPQDADPLEALSDGQLLEYLSRASKLGLLPAAGAQNQEIA